MADKVTTASYEPQPGEIFRILGLAARSKLLPAGNLGGGPGLRCLLVLTVLHVLGRPLFALLIRIEPQLAALYRRVLERGRDGSGEGRRP